jgi:hypothetical protein
MTRHQNNRFRYESKTEGAALPLHFRFTPQSRHQLSPVCTENLNPNVLTMKSAQYRARIYDAGSLNLARDRRILVQ